MPSPSPSVKPTAVPSPSPTLLPTTPMPTPSPTFMPSPSPSVKPTAVPSPSPSLLPTTPMPTPSPTIMPSPSPSVKPTAVPSFSPTQTPTTHVLSPYPTLMPTVSPSQPPTTHVPSPYPTLVPTVSPSQLPTTYDPSPYPTLMPTISPSFPPTTYDPSPYPTSRPLRTVITMAPSTLCIEPEQDWSREIAEKYCSAGDMGVTRKGIDAVVCEGYNQEYQRRLDYSLANQAFMNCRSWCVYDAWTEGHSAERNGAFIWRKSNMCYDPVSSGLCINQMRDERQLIVRRIDNLCQPCISSYTWNQDRAEEVCPEIVVPSKSYGAEVCDDSSARQDSFEKSLANRLYTDCSSWCVYDYDTIISNTLKDTNTNGGFIWQKKGCWRWVTGGVCFEKHISDFREISSRAAKLCEL